MSIDDKANGAFATSAINHHGSMIKQDGLTKREYAAIEAMKALIRIDPSPSSVNVYGIARDARYIADALFDDLEKS